MDSKKTTTLDPVTENEDDLYEALELEGFKLKTGIQAGTLQAGVGGLKNPLGLRLGGLRRPCQND